MLLPFFEWMQGLGVYDASPYLGPAVNIAHLMAMVVFVGANLVVDLRLIGVGLTHQPASIVVRDAAPWVWGALAGLVVTGVPALMAAATELYGNSIFWVKIGVLGAALILVVALRGRAAAAADGASSGTARVVGVLSLLAWVSVAALARLVMMIPGDAFEWLVG